MKRIITCSDGTWNKPNAIVKGKKIRTNVQKLFDYILQRDDHGIAQLRYYDAGIGAEGNFFVRAMSGATGKGIDANIQDVYKFICWNYEAGDEIFVFGFSRGAYTARSLAGLIRKAGIIRKNDLDLISDAYALYRNHTVSPDDPAAIRFKTANSYLPMPHIKFIGVWDTVGSLGLPLRWFQMHNLRKFQFHDTTLSSTVDFAYQALALDERRSTFKPTLWQQSAKVKELNIKQVLEQRWFAGVHSNVGGGYADEGLSDIALDWMIQRAKAAGLYFDDELISKDVKPNPQGQLYNSNKGLFSLFPGYVRPVEPETLIDPSVEERKLKVKGYQPANLPTSFT